MENNGCERCLKETNTTSMSWLNTEMLCMECKEEEKKHPQYEEAKKLELENVRNGNYNYPGLLSKSVKPKEPNSYSN